MSYLEYIKLYVLGTQKRHWCVIGGLTSFVCGSALSHRLGQPGGQPHAFHRCRISVIAGPQATPWAFLFPMPSQVTLSTACQWQNYSINKEGPLQPGPRFQIP